MTTDGRRRALAAAFVLFAVFTRPLLQPVDGHDDDDDDQHHHHHHHHHGSTGRDDDRRPSGQRPPFKILQNVETGDVCRERRGNTEPEYVCTRSSDCEYLAESIRTDNYLDICSFEGKEPIVCCPTAVTDAIKPTSRPKPTRKPTPEPITGPKPTNVRNRYANVVADKCRQYNNMDYPKSDNIYIAVVGGTLAEAQEFPHMAALGYGDTTEDRDDFKCGGSLISEQWILTAAHCHKDSTGAVAKWARLGDLDLKSTTDKSQPADYKIAQHVLHPEYKTTEHYNDIALFRLNSNVKFSSFVRPVCLNVDPSLNPAQQIATGWGRTGSAETTSDELLKITLDVFPTYKCNDTYFSKEDEKLLYGILPESMICAGSLRDNEDTCQGDSGGPLQIKNKDDPDKLTVFGITSFGKFCGDKETPGVYTKVSTYVKWIEQTVWPYG